MEMLILDTAWQVGRQGGTPEEERCYGNGVHGQRLRLRLFAPYASSVPQIAVPLVSYASSVQYIAWTARNKICSTRTAQRSTARRTIRWLSTVHHSTDRSTIC
eukprot:2664730-Rhodomonas_salina.1